MLGLKFSALVKAANAWTRPALAESIRRARRAAGLSVFDLAVKVGTTQNNLEEVEHGRRVPSPALLEALAVTLGLPDFADQAPRARA